MNEFVKFSIAFLGKFAYESLTWIHQIHIKTEVWDLNAQL